MFNDHKLVKPGHRWFSAESPDGRIVYIVDKNYTKKFSSLVSDEEFEIFKKIMANNKYAFLYKDHEVLGRAAIVKMRWKYAILNGSYDNQKGM